MPKVSLITTSYNAAPFLAQSIRSGLGQQDFDDYEFIIWDDGSTDNSVEILSEFCDEPRLKAFERPHKGRAQALISAIALSTGEYFGLLDADDLLAPTALAQTASVLDTFPDTGFVYTDYYDLSKDGEPMGLGHRCTIPYTPQRLLVDFMTFHFRLMRREVYEQVGGFDAALDCAQDWDLCLKFSEVSEILHLSAPLYSYRHHGASKSNTQQMEQIDCGRRAVEAALKRRGMPYELEVRLVPQFQLFQKRA